MSFSLTYNDHVHKFASLPANLEDVKNEVSSTYKDTVPQNYHLEIVNEDKTKKVISNEQEYKELLQSLNDGSQKSVTLHVIGSENKEASTEGNLNEKVQKTPLLIQNKEEFASELAQAGIDSIADRLAKGEAPSDESLPSSPADHREKVEDIKEAVQELEDAGRVLHPKIIGELDSEHEPGPSKKLKQDGNPEQVEHQNGNNNQAVGDVRF